MDRSFLQVDSGMRYTKVVMTISRPNKNRLGEYIIEYYTFYREGKVAPVAAIDYAEDVVAEMMLQAGEVWEIIEVWYEQNVHFEEEFVEILPFVRKVGERYDRTAEV